MPLPLSAVPVNCIAGGIKTRRRPVTIHFDLPTHPTLSDEEDRVVVGRSVVRSQGWDAAAGSSCGSGCSSCFCIPAPCLHSVSFIFVFHLMPIAIPAICFHSVTVHPSSVLLHWGSRHSCTIQGWRARGGRVGRTRCKLK